MSNMWSPPEDRIEAVAELNRRMCNRATARKLVKEWKLGTDWEWINAKREKQQPFVKSNGPEITTKLKGRIND